MKAISHPPGASGPPSAVQRRPFFRIHASKFSFCSLVRRRLGSATPCRMLWLFFVVRKTDGEGLGTYLPFGLETCLFFSCVQPAVAQSHALVREGYSPGTVHVDGIEETDNRVTHLSPRRCVSFLERTRLDRSGSTYEGHTTYERRSREIEAVCDQYPLNGVEKGAFTPHSPPCGVDEKNPILIFFSRSSSASLLTAFQVPWPTD